MKKEVSPAVFWVFIAVVGIAAVAFGFKMLGTGGYQSQKAGGEAQMDKFKKTGEFYKPPVILPGSKSAGGASSPSGPGGMGGYNLKPPDH